MKQQGISDDNWHIVWLDNLFTSAWLLTILRELGFGAAGTVRTTKTKREEQEERTANQIGGKQKEKNRGLDSNLSDLKLKSNSFKRVDPLCFDDCRSPQDWSRCGLHDWRRGIHPKENVLGEYTLGINFSSRIELLEGFAEQYGLKNAELLNASTWAAVYLETWGAEEVYLGRKASTYADEHVDE